MTMVKYKVCPVCGMRNNPLYLECSECESDLQNVPVMDEETEQAQGGGQAAPAEQPAAMVRICDCGAKNPVQARRCSACGDDISFIVPTPDTAPAAQQFLLCRSF